MDIFNKNKNEKDENKTKKVVKRHMLVATVILAVKIFLMLLMIFAVVAVIEWLVKIFQPKNTVDKIYEKLQIDNVGELVQIKGNENDGYYLDFVDDIDDKLKKTIDYLNSTAGVKSGIDKEFLKKMIKTEIATQVPDLGAEVSEDKGFQGITSILRITPNKDIGSFKNTGAGKETIKNEDDSDKNNMTNKSEIAKQEKEVKTWEKGKELTLSAKAFVYSQEDSKLHPGEKIDYWTAQKNKNTLQNLYLSKGTAVKYTGKYSISVDKMTNEGLIYVGIEKDDIKGYIKYNFINKDSEEAGSKDDDEVTNSGYQEAGEEKTTDTIDSNVYKLKYVPQKTFDEYVSNGNKEALYCFTIDDDGNLITATWSIGEDGKIEIQNNSAINLKTALQNYIVPSAYLLYYYIEADYPDFSNELADIALNSKIIMALEDNVSTSKIKRIVENKKVSESSEFSYDWTGEDPTEIITEYCSTKTEIIYADTWCVKIENKSLYKSDLLDVTVGKSKNIKIPGTVTENDGQEEISGEKETGSGTDTKEETNVVIENGKPIIKTTTYTYAYKTYQRTRTITDSIDNSYAEADKVKPEAKEKVFTDLYKKHKMYNRLNDKRFLQILENDDRTANLVDLTKYLMYMATGVDYGVKEYDFSEYAETSMTNVNLAVDGSDGIPLYSPVLDKDSFVKAMKEYGNSGKAGQGFKTNFLPYAADIYDWSVAAGVNPELVIVTAKMEQSFNNPGTNNYWGISVNTQGMKGSSFANLHDGIIGYANVIKSYNVGGSHASGIMWIYNRRKNSGCDPLGYGLPGTFSGMQSQYSATDKTTHLDGKTQYGNFLLNMVYNGSKSDYEKLCLHGGAEHADSAVFTPWESGQYTARQVKDKLNAWNQIFGKYGSLSSGGDASTTSGKIIQSAKKIHTYMEQNNYYYTTTNTSALKATFEESKQSRATCCATYVSWVLRDAGLINDTSHSALGLGQLLVNKYHWQKITDINKLKAGDVIYYENDHHVEIYAGNGQVYNAGTDKAIKRANPYTSTWYKTNKTYGLRAP